MSLPDAEGMWARAVEHHVAGRFAEAEGLYRELLREQRGGAKVLHMLGMAEFQQGRGAAGLASVEAAIALAPGIAKYHGHRGLILASLGNSDAAIEAYRAAVAIEPGASDVLNNLGAALWGRGDFDGAIESYRRALRADPTAIQAAVNLGTLLTNRGELAEAVELLQKAIEQRPGDATILESLAKALNNLAVQAGEQGDVAQSAKALRRALQLCPTFPEAHFNLGKTFEAMHRIDDAIAEYATAIAQKPDLTGAYNNLGILLCARGRVDEGIAKYREALRQQPTETKTINNLGNALRALGKLKEAESAYRQGLQIKPNDAEIWSNLGTVLDAQERLDEALWAFDRSISLRPNFSQVHNNVGNALKSLGNIDGAIKAYQRAIDVDPGNQTAHSNRLYTMYFHVDYSPERILAEHRKWNSAHAARLRPTTFPVRGPRARLRIGYVAPNFRDHCQSLFTVPLLAHHNSEQVEVFAYSDVPVPGAVTQRLRGYADGWRNICGMPDDAVVDLIQRDGIDVLVDLSLHMADNRLLVFARTPAPLQVTWLGYPGTTGLETIDYRLTDPFLDPASEHNDALYSERSYRLPDTFWCYDPTQGSGFGVHGSGNAREGGCGVNDLPAESNGLITFGCLNNFCKVNEPTLDLWAAVLRAIPTSKLLLLAPRAARPRVQVALQRGGVGADRIDFVDRVPRDRYLATYHRIDIGLDTVPYNGHTTSLDAFWMGVPVITLVGNAPVGRAGWSQLNNLGLQSLAATTREQFVQITTALCEDIPRVRELRASLRDRLASSPLMDGARFAMNVEAAFWEMWQKEPRRREGAKENAKEENTGRGTGELGITR